MTPEQLDLLTESERAAWVRCEAATAGLWEHRPVYQEMDDVVSDVYGPHVICNVHRADAAFIAHARQDLPEALEQIAMLRAQLAQMCDGCIGAAG